MTGAVHQMDPSTCFVQLLCGGLSSDEEKFKNQLHVFIKEVQNRAGDRIVLTKKREPQAIETALNNLIHELYVDYTKAVEEKNLDALFNKPAVDRDGQPLLDKFQQGLVGNRLIKKLTRVQKIEADRWNYCMKNAKKTAAILAQNRPISESAIAHYACFNLNFVDPAILKRELQLDSLPQGVKDKFGKLRECNGRALYVELTNNVWAKKNVLELLCAWMESESIIIRLQQALPEGMENRFLPHERSSFSNLQILFETLENNDLRGSFLSQLDPEHRAELESHMGSPSDSWVSKETIEILRNGIRDGSDSVESRLKNLPGNAAELRTRWYIHSYLEGIDGLQGLESRESSRPKQAISDVCKEHLWNSFQGFINHHFNS